MNTFIIICGFPKCGTTSLLYSMRHNMINIGKDSKNEELDDSILDIIPKINNMNGNRFICKQPTYIHRPKLMEKVKKLLIKHKIEYKIIIMIRNHMEQLYSLYQMRVIRQKYNDCDFIDFLNKKYLCYNSLENDINITNLESIDFIKYIKIMIDIFGKDKTYIISQNILSTFEDTSIISKFLGIENYCHKIEKFFNKYKKYDKSNKLINSLSQKYINHWSYLLKYISQIKVNNLI